MVNCRKKVASLSFAIILLIMMAFSGTASATVIKAPPDTKASSTIGIESYQYLQEGKCYLIDSGGGIISLKGYTQAYQNVDYIMVRLYLQQWDGTRWVNLGSWPFENYNASRVDGAKGLEVPRGYYYRTKAEHKLTNNGTNESATSYSNAYYIY